MRRKFKWTKLQKDKLNLVLEILNDLREYLPLTLRQIYYQLVSKDYIENTQSAYTSLSKLIKWGRIDGYIRWNSIEDRVRVFHDLTGWYDSNNFIDDTLKYFLKGYKRDLLQSQEKYIEIWIEKDALASIFQRIAEPYTIPVVVCRGFTSISFLHEFKIRLQYHQDKEPIMLYFGDFDPSGKEMLLAMKTTLQNEMGTRKIDFKRIALTEEQIQMYKLPNNPRALKSTDTRAQKHIEKYGSLAVELDALRPDTLTYIVTNAIESEIDAELFLMEKETEEYEFDKLNNLKEKVKNLIGRV